MEQNSNLTKPKKLWFRAKRFGWGWYPITWQGWSVVASYIAVILAIALPVDETVYSTGDMILKFALPLVVATAMLIAICFKTGEKPRWRFSLKEET